MNDLKIAVIGNVNSSKSTLIGTLIRDKLDNGKGDNRDFVMNFKHEKETGNTSSISYQILGFDKDGNTLKQDSTNKKEIWPKILKNSSKLITFLDLMGHEKYLKNTVYGISSNHPDYAIVLVEGRGMKGMTKEHIMLCLSYKIPFIIIITKIDIYPKDIISTTISQIKKVIEQTKKCSWDINDPNDYLIFNKKSNENVPIFKVSNTTGEGIPLLKQFLFDLPIRLDYSSLISEKLEIAVLESFNVIGVGIVAHGIIVKGVVKLNQIVNVGPDHSGNYIKTKIKSIHYKRLAVDFANAGNHVCVCLPSIDRNLLKHGVYILDYTIPPIGIRNFTARLKINTGHSTTIKIGYSPVLNIDNIRMVAKILEIKDTEGNVQEYIRSGDTAIVKMYFIYRPAYLHLNDTFIFREGRTRGFGQIIDF